MQLEERNKTICRLREEGCSVSDLSHKFGPSPQQIRNILRAGGVNITTKRKGPKEAPISSHHAQIGNRISMRRTTEKAENSQAFGVAVGLTAYQVNLLEAGRYDPTISDLHRIAEYCGVPINQLIEFREDVRRNA